MSNKSVVETPKGEQIPQTVEALREIMARDAETMLALEQEKSQLLARINRLEQKLQKAKRSQLKKDRDSGLVPGLKYLRKTEDYWKFSSIELRNQMPRYWVTRDFITRGGYGWTVWEMVSEEKFVNHPVYEKRVNRDSLIDVERWIEEQRK